MTIALEGVSKGYDRIEALQPLNLTIPGGVFGLLGPNGAGKTSLLRILATTLEPSAGRGSVFGLDLHRDRRNIRRLLGYLPQDFRAYPTFNAYDYLQYMAWLKEMPSGASKKRIAQALDLVNLMQAARRRTSTYSGGMLRRLGIAQALLNDPQLLIVDEPTAGLDLEERLRFRNFLAELPPTQVTILATHLVEDIEAVCDHLAVLHRGRLLFQGAKEDLLRPLQGLLFEATVPEGWLEQHGKGEQNAQVLTIHRQEGRLRVRLLHRQGMPLPPDAASVKPSVQDAYLALVHDETLAAAALA